MIDKLIDYLTSITKPAITSVGSAGFGTLLSISEYTKPLLETCLQYTAWAVAIIAGLVAIVNGIDTFFSKRLKHTRKIKRK